MIKDGSPDNATDLDAITASIQFGFRRPFRATLPLEKTDAEEVVRWVREWTEAMADDLPACELLWHPGSADTRDKVSSYAGNIEVFGTVRSLQPLPLSLTDRAGEAWAAQSGSPLAVKIAACTGGDRMIAEFLAPCRAHGGPPLHHGDGRDITVPVDTGPQRTAPGRSGKSSNKTGVRGAVATARIKVVPASSEPPTTETFRVRRVDPS